MDVKGKLIGLVLAAGRSSRMGKDNKLLLPVGGEPMVARVVRHAMASRLDDVLVVTGHDGDAVAAALPPGTAYLENPDFAEGMATSLRVGVEALEGARGVMVLLADMPDVLSEHINWLVAHFADDGVGSIVVAASDVGRGNPVLFAARHFPALRAVEGDRGAKSVVEAGGRDVVQVRIGPAAQRDIDTPEAYARLPSSGPKTS